MLVHYQPMVSKCNDQRKNIDGHFDWASTSIPRCELGLTLVSRVAPETSTEQQE
jgi:hypothetical protein